MVTDRRAKKIDYSTAWGFELRGGVRVKIIKQKRMKEVRDEHFPIVMCMKKKSQKEKKRFSMGL